MSQLVTQSEFAKLQQVSRQYVSKLIKSGRITLKAGKVDVELARAAIAATADPAKPTKMHPLPVAGPREFPPRTPCAAPGCGHPFSSHPDDGPCNNPHCDCWEFVRPLPILAAQQPEQRVLLALDEHDRLEEEFTRGARVTEALSKEGLGSLLIAQTFKEQQLALKHKHELEVKQGKYVEAAGIQQVFDRFCVSIRNAMRGIPARMAPDLAQQDAAAIEEMLQEAISVELDRLSRNPFQVESAPAAEGAND